MTDVTSDDREQYRELIDALVRACREGQGQIGSRRVRHGVWNSNATGRDDALTGQHSMNVLLGRLSDADREVLAEMLEQSFVSGVHETLATLHQEAVPPFAHGYESTPFHDFVGRLQGWSWPIG